MKTICTIIFCSISCLSWTQNVNYASSIEEHRIQYKKDFLADERAPLEAKDIDSLIFYEPNELYKVTCSVKLTPDEKQFDLPTYSGITKPFKKYAELTFSLNDQLITLSAYQNLKVLKMPMYKDHLFIPFKDLTNGNVTYGGGRYIDMNTSDIVHNSMVLDFNKAYNPWCAYSYGYNCPIPPNENHLDIELII